MLIGALSQGLLAEDTQRLQLLPSMQHLRSGSEREWTEFPTAAPLKEWSMRFTAASVPDLQTLVIRQQDVKQGWHVAINGSKIGELTRDENDMLTVLAIPLGTIRDGENEITVQPANSSATSDDIWIGQIELIHCSAQQLLRESQVSVDVIDADTKKPIPCRVTITNTQGALQTIGAQSNDHQAVRTGTVFSSTGHLQVGLPAGRYTLFAGRGFEYSLDQKEIVVERGESVTVQLTIRREVPTEGYVACDTHIHTLTHSGHGDATIEEQILAIAGEGIELPIATDHNKHIYYEPIAEKLNVRQYFSPVVGNEVTTPRGHFNIFPIQAGTRIVNYSQSDWELLFDEIWTTPGVKVAILNHARDLHSKVRPFGPEHYNALVAEQLDGWPMRFNAMEIINSGATQSKPLRLLSDWVGMLNRGYDVTPVGSSDSHDVARFFVGQGRTYIRCDDRDVAGIDIDEAVASFVAGKVMVSYGLLAEIKVNDHWSSGDFATKLDADTVQVEVRVLGPHWTGASHVQLLANGVPIRQSSIDPAQAGKLPLGVKWQGSWEIEKPAHDVNLVAVATGPSIDGNYWRTAKPYQPESPEWQGATIGCSGAVWLDCDGDGVRTSARQYAERLVTKANGDWPKIVADLARYDEVVAAHTAHLLNSAGISLESDSLLEALKNCTSATAAGFQAYRETLRENELHRATIR
jgi:hypothetical protein